MCEIVSLFGSKEFLSAVIGAGIGGAIAGISSMKAVDRSYKNDLKKRNEDEENLVNAYLYSVRDEMETVWNRYMSDMGKEVEKLQKNEPLLRYYPITQNYFSIYESGTYLIGKIKDADLRRLIIKTYTKAKGLKDSFKYNNDLAQKHERLIASFQETQNMRFREQANELFKGLAEYAQKIKEQHDELKLDVEDLLKKIPSA